MIGSRCRRCGRDPALGWAAINEDRYCHDSPLGVASCYELAQWDTGPTLTLTEWLNGLGLETGDGSTPG